MEFFKELIFNTNSLSPEKSQMLMRNCSDDNIVSVSVRGGHAATCAGKMMGEMRNMYLK